MNKRKTMTDNKSPVRPYIPPHENNPKNEPTGHFTGRCMRCGSKDLWDDNLAYGCNTCGATYV